MNCPHCRPRHLPTFRFAIVGRFHSRNIPQELGSALTREKAEQFLADFKKWPAIDPESLVIKDRLEK